MIVKENTKSHHQNLHGNRRTGGFPDHFKFADLNVSSATIRNEMSDLTDMGYIVQPHTSAGRIPSDKGYRLYVDELMKEKESEVQEIKDLMIEKTDKLDKMLKQVAKVLASIPTMQQ